MEWEEVQNELVRTEFLVQQEIGTVPMTPMGLADTYEGAQTTPGNPWPENRDVAYAPHPGRYAGEMAQAIHRCSTNSHYFECKHETRCECGQVERLPLELPEGM